MNRRLETIQRIADVLCRERSSEVDGEHEGAYFARPCPECLELAASVHDEVFKPPEDKTLMLATTQEILGRRPAREHQPPEENELLRRALKNHDAIAAALRLDASGPRLVKAIEDMIAVKKEAAELGCYPKAADVLRQEGDRG